MKKQIVFIVCLQALFYQNAIAQAIPKCGNSYPQNIIETQTVTQYSNSPVIQTVETLQQGPCSVPQFLPNQQLTTFLQNQPQIITNQPQIITGQPQIITGQPQIINSPQCIPSQPQILSSQPHFLTNQPQILTNQPQIISCPPKTLPGLPQFISLPQQNQLQPTTVFLPEAGQKITNLIPGQSSQVIPGISLGGIPQITTVSPGTTTIIQDSSVSNNLANALQLLVVSNLLSNTLPLSSVDEACLPLCTETVQQFVSYPPPSCNCNKGYVY